MLTKPQDSIELTANPLDDVEQILNANNWVFDRTDDNELLFKLDGQSCAYHIFFIWDETIKTLQICCQYDFQIDLESSPHALLAVAKINHKLWLGHFDIPLSSGNPSFRYACMMHGVNETTCSEHMHKILDIALTQCEQYHHAFHMLSVEGANDNPQNLNLALMQTQGKA